MKPTPVASPKLTMLNDSLAKNLGLNLSTQNTTLGTQIFAGNKIPLDALPIAQAYAGHQFGYFTKLGDGRAILLGEQITPSYERFDIQLKGSGLTPYSRGGDGRASLGPMLREYIISEAMYALGIPTTRSLAVVTTGENVYRQLPEIGAVLTRIAKSHIRVGTFQYIANWGTFDELKLLADYTINRHYKDIVKTENPYLELLNSVIKKQASLIAKWQLVGFIHGVMNTDNMTISGETIDYGPCAFMNNYDISTVFSSIDQQGRYAYGNQPQMGAWDLARLAEALLQLIDVDQEKAVNLAQEKLEKYNTYYYRYWLVGIGYKTG